MSGPAPTVAPSPASAHRAPAPEAKRPEGGGALKQDLRGAGFDAGAARLGFFDWFVPGGPADQKTQPDKGGGAARAPAGRGVDAAAAKAPETPEVAAGAVDGELAAALAKEAGQAKGQAQDAKVDASRALAEAKAWTLERLGQQDTERAVAVLAKLDASYAGEREAFDRWVADGKPAPARGKKAPKDPGARETYVRARWVSAYWHRWCYQFAAKVQSFIGRGKHPGLARLVARTKDASERGEAASVKGRTTLHRGSTLAELGAAELANPQLAPGTSIHVKLHFEGDNPYEYPDDFHHWVIYVGEGRFSDTLTGENKPGEAHDKSLRAWVKSGFKGKDFKAFHEDPRFSVERRRGVPVPREGLQPRASAEYDPRMAVARREG